VSAEGPSARELAANDISVGLSAEFERDVDEATVLEFARVSGDANPLHVSPEYAATTNYGERIAHGALQVGFASAMIGMFLPGKRVLLMSTQARFPSPLYFPARVRVTGTVISWNRETLKGMVKVVVAHAGTLATTAEVYMGFTLHDERALSEPTQASPAVVADASAASRRLVLLTGASGGLASGLLPALVRHFDVIALTNRSPLEASLAELPGVRQVRADLADDAWTSAVDLARAGRPLFGVIHAAWPGMPKGGLLAADDDVVEQQMRFGTVHLVALARLLAASVDASGGRLVAVGSTAGSTRPSINYASYSLGKAALEHTVALLAPELARKAITINAVCPPLLPVGMNKHLNERQRLIEVSRVPVGRLCDVGDVSALVGYLLSDDASFVTGQSIVLNGGQLAG
jgi:NAD(P)-dependent dehydrogenase (short-subunit alcohol dehydrogenase family)/acyl dehydratase